MKILSIVLFSLFAALTPCPCLATYHVFVRTPEGVWLASDSLLLHSDGHVTTKRIVCKVVVARNRLIFSAGEFKNLPELMRQEEELPLADEYTTTHALGNILLTAHQDKLRTLSESREIFDVSARVIQVTNGNFEAYAAYQNASLETTDRYLPPPFEEGLPHDLQGVKSELTKDDTSPQAQKAFLSNPKRELLRVMRRVASHNQTVGQPFTILLLHPDGTVSDVSDADGRGLCSIPKNARYHPAGRAVKRQR